MHSENRMTNNDKNPSNLAALENRGFYIYVQYQEFAIIDAEAVREQGIAYAKICNEHMYPFIFDGLDVTISYSHEAREMIANLPQQRAVINAVAFILNNTPNKMLANYFKKYHQPTHPFKVFSNLKEAEDWVKQFKVEKIKS